jgi:hypothetical protein
MPLPINAVPTASSEARSQSAASLKNKSRPDSIDESIPKASISAVTSSKARPFAASSSKLRTHPRTEKKESLTPEKLKISQKTQSTPQSTTKPSTRTTSILKEELLKTRKMNQHTVWKDYKVVGSTIFTVPSLYHDLKPVGMGAFGLVCSAKKRTTGELPCAIKKIAG